MSYGGIDIGSKAAKPDWKTNAEIITAYEAARATVDSDVGTRNTTRNVMAAVVELARTIEPQLLTEATADGILQYARSRRLKCKHLQGDGNGGWACRRRGGLAHLGGDIQYCPLMRDASRGPDCPQYHRLAWSSQLQHLSALSSAYGWMRARGAIHTNPVPDAQRQFLHETKSRRAVEDRGDLARLLTNEELARLLAATGGDLYRLLCIQAKAGLRIGEVLAIRFQDVDAEGRTFHIPTPNPYCNKRRGLRDIRMDAELYSLFDMQLRGRRPRDESEHVFVNRYGQAYDPRNGKQDINKKLQRAAVRAGIQAEDAPPSERVTPHCLRRWFTNQLAPADLVGVSFGVQLLLRGDKLPGALSRYVDQPALAAPLWREHMPRLPVRGESGV